MKKELSKTSKVILRIAKNLSVDTKWAKKFDINLPKIIWNLTQRENAYNEFRENYELIDVIRTSKNTEYIFIN